MDIEIRHETGADRAAVTELLNYAFGGSGEAEVVTLLHASGQVVVSLVAVADVQMVGHILFSKMSIEPFQADFNALGLAPLAVLPGHQGFGIGSRLVVEGLVCCADLGYTSVFVLGHTNYYSRFGFVPAHIYRLESEYDAGDAFMALELYPGALGGMRGTVHYRLEFRQAGV